MDEDDEPRWTDLQLAAKDGDVGRVQALLASGREDVNAPAAGYYGRTALQAASQSGTEAVVRLLLEAGADVDAPGGNNSMRTALQLACGREEEKEENEVNESDESDESDEGQTGDGVVELLLAAGANIHSPAARYCGRTALQAAAERGSLRCVRRLLLLGADVNASPSTTAGLTALQAAGLRPAPLAVVQALLDAGADVNAPASRHKGFTALQAACIADTNSNSNSNTNLPLVELLLAAGADPDAPGSKYLGVRALHAAAHMGHADIVRRLLSAGANVNLVAGPSHQTPLQTALFNDQLECADILRQAGGTVNPSRARFLFD